MDRKKLRTRNAIFVEGKAARNGNTGSSLEFPSQPANSNEENTGTSDESKEQRRRTQSEVWGTDPTRRSERISNKVFITQNTSNVSEVKIQKAYNDAISSPEGNFWKDAMYYELTKLKEMNTWSEVDQTNILQDAQVLPGMWVHIVKNLESGDQKF